MGSHGLKIREAPEGDQFSPQEQWDKSGKS